MSENYVRPPYSPFDLTIEKELYSNYLSNVERQIVLSKEHFLESKRIIVSEDQEDEFAIPTTYYLGLEDQTYNLEYIFNEYYPNLQRKAAFITLHSFLETALNKFCKEIQNIKKFNLSYKDLKNQGIERSIDYLEKLAELNIRSRYSIWSEIVLLTKIRNVFVHNGIDYLVDSPKENNVLLTYIKKNEAILDFKNGEIYLKESFLRYVNNKYSLFLTDISRDLLANFK